MRTWWPTCHFYVIKVHVMRRRNFSELVCWYRISYFKVDTYFLTDILHKTVLKITLRRMSEQRRLFRGIFRIFSFRGEILQNSKDIVKYLSGILNSNELWFGAVRFSPSTLLQFHLNREVALLTVFWRIFETFSFRLFIFFKNFGSLPITPVIISTPTPVVNYPRCTYSLINNINTKKSLNGLSKIVLKK